MPAGRQEARTAALMLAIALHVLVFLLALQLRARPKRTEVAEDPFMMSIQIPEERRPETRTPPPERERVRPLVRATPAPPQPDEPRTESITLPPEATPRIDWYREAEITVQNMGDVTTAKQPSLRSEPEVMTLPERKQGPKVGDAWILPNGITVVQTSEHVTCESGPQFVGDVFEIWARTAPVRCTYKAPPKPELKLKDRDLIEEQDIKLP